MTRHGRKVRDDYPIGRAFDVVTRRLELAHEMSVRGQDPLLDRAAQRDFYRRLVRLLGQCALAADRLGAEIDRTDR